MRAPPAILILLLATSLSDLAWAQARDAAAATELFAKGRAAMKQQDFGTACAAFEESQKFDPKVGTLLNLADCEEHVGRLISARSHWQQAADLAHAASDARESVARQRFNAVDPRVAKLSVKLAPDAPANAAVKRDDVALGPGSLGVPLPLDPGPHSIVVTADGYDSQTTAVSLVEGQAAEVVVSLGAKHPPPPPPPSPVATPLPPPRSGTTQRVLAVSGAGLGVAGVALGTVFGLIAKSNNDASMANGACDANNACNVPGLASRDAAVRDGTISTIAFAAGGAFLVAGVVLWFTAPSTAKAESASRAGLRLAPAGATLVGAF
jgi:hypothetical protein